MEIEKYIEILKDKQQGKQSQKLDKFQEKDGILYRRNKDDENKLLKVIRRFEMEPLMYIMHDHPTGAHFGTEILSNRIKENYYYPKMKEYIQQYIKSCDRCQRQGKNLKKNELHPIKIIKPFYHWGIDFLGPLPTTESGNRYIIVATDYFTKWPEAKATSEATAKEAVKFIYENIICTHGIPKKITTDRGTHFNNQLMKELTEKFRIKHNLSTPYHPETNGLVERFNKTIGKALAKLSDQTPEWESNIPPILFAYRTSKHNSTGITPFYLTYGREAELPISNDDKEVTMTERIETLINELPIKREKAKTNNMKSQQRQKKYHDQKKLQETFEIGQKVLYYIASKEKQWSGKLDDKWKGPYYIHERLLNGAYRLKETTSGKILETPVNGKLLKKYYSRENFEPFVVI